LELELRASARLCSNLLVLGGAVATLVAGALRRLGLARREAMGATGGDIAIEFLAAASLPAEEVAQQRLAAAALCCALREEGFAEIEGATVPDIGVFGLWDSARVPTGAFWEVLFSLEARVGYLLACFPSLLATHREGALARMGELLIANVELRARCWALFDSTAGTKAWEEDLRVFVLQRIVESYLGAEFKQMERTRLAVVVAAIGAGTRGKRDAAGELDAQMAHTLGGVLRGGGGSA